MKLILARLLGWCMLAASVGLSSSVMAGTVFWNFAAEPNTPNPGLDPFSLTSGGNTINAYGFVSLDGTGSPVTDLEGWKRVGVRKSSNNAGRNPGLGVDAGNNGSTPPDPKQGHLNEAEAILFEFGSDLWQLLSLDLVAFNRRTGLNKDNDPRDGDRFSVYLGDTFPTYDGVDYDFENYVPLVQNEDRDTDIPTGNPQSQYALLVAELSANDDQGGSTKFRVASITGSIPEPGTVALVGLSLLALGFGARRRKS